MFLILFVFFTLLLCIHKNGIGVVALTSSSTKNVLLEDSVLNFYPNTNEEYNIIPHDSVNNSDSNRFSSVNSADPFQCFLQSSSISTCDLIEPVHKSSKTKSEREKYRSSSSSSSFFRRAFTPHSEPPLATAENSTFKPDGLVEGSGTYLCIFRGSQLGGQLFIRDVGNFRCNFQGARRTKNAFIGVGYYQCNYQKPGQEQTITFGVGQYICFFQGVRRAIGFPDPLVAPKYKSAFIEVLGTVNGNWGGGIDLSTALSGQGQGQFQLFGIYQFGREGFGNDFGFLQALETYEIQLENTNEIVYLGNSNNDHNNNDGKAIIKENKRDFTELDIKLANKNADLDDLIEPRSKTSSIQQLGQFIYAFKGTEFDNGRSQINQNMAYNIARAWGSHAARLFIARYDYSGAGQFLGQTEDFVQVWGVYEYKVPDIDPEYGTVDLQAIAITEYGIGLEVDQGNGIGIEFFQLVAQCTYLFTDHDTNSGTLLLQGVYQANSELSVSGQATDLLMAIIRFTYVMTGQRPGETGFIVIWSIYNYYLELEAERAGYVEIIVSYGRVFPGDGKTWLTLEGTSISLSTLVIYEVNFPEIILNNGFYQGLLDYVIDISAVFTGLGIPIKQIGKKAVPGQTLGTITLSALYKCIFFGINDKTKYICYIILYALYEIDILGGDESPGPRQVILQTQYFQEFTNDNIKEED